MAKKKKPTMPKKQEFIRNPFSHLKGFAVSGEEVEETHKKSPSDEGAEQEVTIASFADEMAQLGVERINTSDCDDFEPRNETPVPEVKQRTGEPSEEEQFLLAMGELQVDFSDKLPEENEPPIASASRMKQLKQGKLSPEATLDLHGLMRTDVVEKLAYFLQNAARQGWQTLLVITGRGLHSADGEPVLRKEAERYLAAEGRKWVTEWSRAPKQYGGDGALILFLRKNA